MLNSEGYLLVDTKRCSGCTACMLACSLAHDGEASLSRSRIQVLQDSFMPFPHDLTLEQCRQCGSPACVDACPTGALYVDSDHGHIRRIDAEACDGCRSCIRACLYSPSRISWNPETQKAVMCDLCLDTPFWSEQGGVGGKQACVQVCPFGAITFTEQTPVQQGDIGYKVKLTVE